VLRSRSWVLEKRAKSSLDRDPVSTRECDFLGINIPSFIYVIMKELNINISSLSVVQENTQTQETIISLIY